MATPTILIVPDRFKSGVLYSQLPESGAVDFDVTRATTAFRTNASGILESVASGVPRLDYPAAGGCPSLLVEPAATNSIRNNSMQGAVTGTPGTLPTNWQELTPSPAGLTREIIAIGTESGVDYIEARFSGTATSTGLNFVFEQNTQIAAVASQQWTNSCFVRVVSAPNPPVNYGLGMVQRNSGGEFIATQNTIITPNSSLLRYSSNYALTPANTAFVTPFINATIVSGSTYDFTIRIGWPQMEQGSVATSPIRTTTAAATRNADVISKTGVSGFIGQTEGTIYAEVDLRNLSTATKFVSQLFQNVDNRLGIAYFRNGNDLRIQAFGRINGAFTAVINYDASLTAGIYKIALAYKVNDWVLYVNGIQRGTNTTSAVVSTSVINLAHSDGTSQLNDRIRAAAIYTTRLSNTELAQLTSL
jgi:hypothetical protein